MMYLSSIAKKYKVQPLIEKLTYGLDKWSTENECVSQLESFSAYIPPELLFKYVNALTQTYIGSTGYSSYHARTDFFADTAVYKIPGMFEKFDDAAAEEFIQTIKTNREIKHRINNPDKMRRLRSLGNIVLERVSNRFKDKLFLELLVDDTKENEFYRLLKSK